jgi:hypothetical protein
VEEVTTEDTLRTALEQIGDSIDQALALLAEGKLYPAKNVLQSASASAHELGGDGGEQ